MTFYIHDGATALRLEIAGNLSGSSVGHLERVWCTASSVIGSRSLVIALDRVTDLDPSGRALICRWRDAGAQLVAKSPLARTLVGSITGHPVIPDIKAIERHGWTPIRSSALKLIPLLALLFPATAFAANLEPQTAGAWEAYVDFAQKRMEQRLHTGNTFLWVDELPERLAKVRRGEVVLSPIGGENPRRVPGGLIHDWVGAVFISNAKLKDVLSVMRDYDRYKDFYSPGVIASKAITRTESKDQYSVLFVDKSLFMKTALETDYESCYVHIDDRQGYSVSRATRIQEIEEYGAQRQRASGPGEGSGLVWRLFNITRYLERDGGVYLELDAVGLSRDIPGSLRWFVEPIVRRVSRGSLSTSLGQTVNAVRSRSAGAKTDPSGEERMTVSASGFSAVHATPPPRPTP